jgi:tetratricopeptide (TPR) repeat protein
MKSNQTQDAEAALQALAKANPQASGPQANLGILYAKTNRKPEARAAFERAVALNPGNAVAHNWLGVLAREAGEYAKAEGEYRAALNADPSAAAAQLNLAILYDLYLKRPVDALAAYRKYEEMTGGKDARTSVWISELQAAQNAPAAAPAATPATKPVQGRTQS